MPFSLRQLHDATLIAVRFDWVGRTCLLEFAGAPSLAEPFALMFFQVSEVSIPASAPWGPSTSVLEGRNNGNGRYEFAMQSGDTIAILSHVVPTFQSSSMRSLADIEPVSSA